MRENGGEVRTPPDAWILYPFFDTSTRKRLQRTFNDIIRETEAARQWDTFPQNAVAIGANGCGDHLIYVTAAGSSQLGNAVYWWDHETSEIYQVAADFSKL